MLKTGKATFQYPDSRHLYLLPWDEDQAPPRSQETEVLHHIVWGYQRGPRLALLWEATLRCRLHWASILLQQQRWQPRGHGWHQVLVLERNLSIALCLTVELRCSIQQDIWGQLSTPLQLEDEANGMHHLRKHHQWSTSDHLEFRIVIQIRVLEGKFPPGLFID